MTHNEHSSCEAMPKPSSQNRGFRYCLVSLLAALIACLCCSVPLLAVAIGLAGASSLNEYFGKNHGAFQALAVTILLATSGFMWFQKTKGKMSTKGFFLQVAIVLSMYGMMTVLMEKMFGSLLAERGYGITEEHSKH